MHLKSNHRPEIQCELSNVISQQSQEQKRQPHVFFTPPAQNFLFSLFVIPENSKHLVFDLPAPKNG